MADGLQGKIAWVTGAGSGIGESAALKLAEAGAVVVLTGRREAPLLGVAERIRAGGGAAHVRAADLGKSEQVRAATEWIGAALGRLDILVSNAGGNITDRAWSRLSPAGVDELIANNLSSAFYCAQAVLPMMRAQGGGLMIHTASMAGRNIGPMSGPGYVAAKHGVVAMSHSINIEECANGIRSCALLPGEVNTPILRKRPNPLSQEDLARMLQPEDVGEMIRHIASLPPHVCVNEIWLTPTWNRGYLAQQGHKL
jgi:NAD(P)-dependent dehydrogenase (short-subunit alcohol dehydrogenase family)